jgi:predicted RecB family nuclease
VPQMDQRDYQMQRQLKWITKEERPIETGSPAQTRNPVITDTIIDAYLRCPFKAYQLLSERSPPVSEYVALAEHLDRAHIDRVRRAFPQSDVVFPLVHEDLSTHPDGVERVRKSKVFAPIRIFPWGRLSDIDRVTLGFDGLVMKYLFAKAPTYGVAIVGPEARRTRLSMPALIRRAVRTVESLRVFASGPAPRLMLNKNCEYCGFRNECHERAIAVDDLSLMSGLKKAEIAAAHKKGIFTIIQFSYTFRPNRRRKRLLHEWSLQALSLREHRTHVLVPLELPPRHAAQPALFLDVEGDADAASYYLVGVLVVADGKITQHSFWANHGDEEESIWRGLLDVAVGFADFRLFHYGSYETTFLRRMSERYPSHRTELAVRLCERATNVLGLIHGHVHFPALSNGLKDIAGHLGFRWSGPVVTGLQCALWRRRWENNRDDWLCNEITTYNAEDCAALRVVVEALYAIRDHAPGYEAVDASMLKARGVLGKFKKNEFFFPELEVINSCAYFNYQRERILLRTNRTVRTALRREAQTIRRKPRVNHIVHLKPPARCPRCHVNRPYRHRRFRKRQIDLRFGPGYMKRWVTEYQSAQYRCRSCRKTWFLRRYLEIGTKYGRNLGCWVVYQVIAQKQSSGAIIATLGEAFGIHINRQKVQTQKHEFAEYYRSTYDAILGRIAQAPLVHVDETKANILGASGYVWVFAAPEEVAYVYAGSRDGTVLERALTGFRGVLVSDFYTAYDSMPCPQQKCLVHLIRDLNDDLFRNQLDDELRDLVQAFARLLQPIISTIDERGLRKRYLGKYKRPVARFFDDLSKHEFRSELAEKNRTRLMKCWGKLFTFLEHDGIPWNNNGAENAIKEFAALRRAIGGVSTESGMGDYLTLLSIRQTLKRHGIGFLEFLLSGQRDIERFVRSRR